MKQIPPKIMKGGASHDSHVIHNELQFAGCSLETRISQEYSKEETKSKIRISHEKIVGLGISKH
jgi:hypothetical protein